MKLTKKEVANELNNLFVNIGQEFATHKVIIMPQLTDFLEIYMINHSFLVIYAKKK